MNRFYFDLIYFHGLDLWSQFYGKKIFVAGNSGFYGRWFEGFFRYLRDVKGITLEINGGSRSTGFNVLNPSGGDFYEANYVINCAGTSGAIDFDSDYTTHVEGSLHLLNEMAEWGTLLHFSSGAARGGGTKYARAKWESEWSVTGFNNVQIVRPFATVGPEMGLDKHFAVSTFIRQSLNGEPIEIAAHEIRRSFVHITDLMVQCLHVMVRGDHMPYEVGSDDVITIEHAARLLSEDVKVVNRSFASNALTDTYYADLTRIRERFNLNLAFDSKSAIMDTYKYYADNRVTEKSSGNLV